MKVAILLTGQPRFVDLTAAPMRQMVEQLNRNGIETDVYLHSWNNCFERYISRQSAAEIQWNELNPSIKNLDADVNEVKTYIQKRWKLPDHQISVTDQQEINDLHTDLINLDLALRIPKKVANINENFFESAIGLSTYRDRAGHSSLDIYTDPNKLVYRQESFRAAFGQLFSYKKAVEIMVKSGKIYDLVIRIRHDAMPDPRPGPGHFWITPKMCTNLLYELSLQEQEYDRIKQKMNNQIEINGVNEQYFGRENSGVLLFPTFRNDDAQRVAQFDIWTVSHMHAAICFTQTLQQDLIDSVSYASSLHHYDTHLTNLYGMHHVWGLVGSLNESQISCLKHIDHADYNLYLIDAILRNDINN